MFLISINLETEIHQLNFYIQDPLILIILLGKFDKIIYSFVRIKRVFVSSFSITEGKSLQIFRML